MAHKSESVSKAVKYVINDRGSVVLAAKRYGVSRAAIHQRIAKEKKAARAEIAADDDRVSLVDIAPPLYPAPLTKQDREAILFNLRHPLKGIQVPLPHIIERYEATVNSMIDTSNRMWHMMEQNNALHKDKRDLLTIVSELTLNNFQLKMNAPNDCAAGQQATSSAP